MKVISQVSAGLALLKEERRKVDFDHIWFSRKTAILEGDTICTGSVLHIDKDGTA